MGAEFFHADRQTDRHDGVNIRFSQFCERAKNTTKYTRINKVLTLTNFIHVDTSYD
jgi:hypothetical protein